MFLIYASCLLALVSTGFSYRPVELPRDSNPITRLSSPRGNDLYGATTGFKSANIKDHPYLASITYTQGMLSQPFGAAAIINKNWVLTTAVLSVLSPEKLSVFVGTNFAGRKGQRSNVTKIIPHEKFDTDYLNWYNIALLKLETPIEFNDKAQAAKLASSIPKVGTNVTVLGYGFIQDSPYCGYDLGAATVKIGKQAPCVRTYGALKTSFCAGAKDVQLCVGDFADLLIYQEKLVGFYINGDFCYPEHTSQIYTKVPAFKKWIWKTIKDNSDADEMEGLFEAQFISEVDDEE